jgi:hypothetical protein
MRLCDSTMAARLKHERQRGSAMSKANNVNPGQYKVAGRERPGEPLGQERDKMQFSKNQQDARHARRQAGRKQGTARAGRSKG